MEQASLLRSELSEMSVVRNLFRDNSTEATERVFGPDHFDSFDFAGGNSFGSRNVPRILFSTDFQSVEKTHATDWKSVVPVQ